MEKRNKYWIIGIVVAFIAGYALAYASAMNMCYDIGTKLVEVHIKPELLSRLLDGYGLG